jgi:hypothetical protein
MGDVLRKALRARGNPGGGEHARKPPSLEERRALHKLRQEARAAGAKLKSGGVGGLSAGLVLHVMRRDGYRCHVHGDRGEGEYGGLELHHKGGIPESAWLSRKGHKNEPNNLVTLCAKAHNELHEKARARGVDSSQVTPEGDMVQEGEGEHGRD